MKTLLVRDRSFYEKVLRIAVPVTMQQIITIGINMMDTVMLGSFGEIPISASSLANQYTNIFHFISMGTGCGAAVMTARYWGKGDIPALKKIITLAFRMTLIIASVFTFLAVVFPDKIMQVYTPDILVIESGVKYFKYLGWTYLFNGIAVVLTQVLRSVGISHIQMKSSLLAFAVNVFFNWVFIFGKLGAPRLEIMGAAVGTLVARILECMYLGGYLLWKDKRIQYQIRDLLLPCDDQIALYLHFSVPVICSDLLAGLGDNVLSMIMGRISAEFVAANAITMLMVRLCTAMSTGISNAASNITGNTLGEGDTDRAYNQGHTLILLSFAIGAVSGGVIVLLRVPVLSMYNINQETYQTAWQLMLAIGVILGFRTMGSTLTKGVLRGGGDTHFLLLGDVIFIWIVSIPLGYAAAFVWQLSAFWIYLCFRAEFILKSILCWTRFHSGRWIKKL